MCEPEQVWQRHHATVARRRSCSRLMSTLCAGEVDGGVPLGSSLGAACICGLPVQGKHGVSLPEQASEAAPEAGEMLCRLIVAGPVIGMGYLERGSVCLPVPQHEPIAGQPVTASTASTRADAAQHHGERSRNVGAETCVDMSGASHPRSQQQHPRELAAWRLAKSADELQLLHGFGYVASPLLQRLCAISGCAACLSMLLCTCVAKRLLLGCGSLVCNA